MRRPYKLPLLLAVLLALTIRLNAQVDTDPARNIQPMNSETYHSGLVELSENAANWSETIKSIDPGANGATYKTGKQIEKVKRDALADLETVSSLTRLEMIHTNVYRELVICAALRDLELTIEALDEEDSFKSNTGLNKMFFIASIMNMEFKFSLDSLARVKQLEHGTTQPKK